jgi:hypothetical protein
MLPTFRDNLPDPSLPLEIGPVCPETSVTNYYSMLRKTPKSSHVCINDICEILDNRRSEDYTCLTGVHEINLTRIA